MVREGFYLSGYDKNNYGTSSWNPLSKFIKAGDTVLIKPNMVMDENHIKENGTECLFKSTIVLLIVSLPYQFPSWNWSFETGVLIFDIALNGKTVDSLKKEDFLYFIPTSGWKKAFREKYKSEK